ncbi:MAG: DUF3971 domain-containing protein [Gammaproteobacteria bacterium]|nr:DUF3971 domain-containing protein [Gammaproteobacteria bacterium]
MLLNWLKKTFSFTWHFHRKLVISLIISLAIVLLTLNAIVFYLEKNHQVVEALVETHLQTKVTFDKIKIGVHLLYPSVSMNNFTIQNELDEESLLEFGSASIRLNIPLSIMTGQLVIDTLDLKGFNAIIHRDVNNEISIADFQLTKQSTKSEKNKTDSGKKLQYYFSLLNQTNFIISESEIYFIDDMKEIPEILVSGINLKMKNNNERHQISLLARLNDSATFLDFQLDFNGDINDISNWDGKVYAAIKNLNQQALLHFLQKDFVQVEEFQLNDIQANAKIWSTIIKGNLNSVQGEFDIENANLNRVDNDKSIHFDKLSTNFKLQRNKRSDIKEISQTEKNETSWMLDLFNFNLSVDSKLISEKFISMRLENVKDSHLTHVQLFLDKIIIGEFSDVISFFSPKDFNKKIFSHLKPKGQVENVITTFQFNPSEMPIDIQSYQVQLDINNFGMNSVLSLPKIKNFSTKVLFNEEMGRAIVNSTDMELYIKSVFRNNWPIEHLTGEFFWQRENNEWFVGVEKLSLKSPHYSSANADINFWISPTGKTFMDLTAFYENVNVEAISNYIPAHVMNPGLVEWLDYSLISGLVPDGGMVFRGNLSDFPYKEHNGNMDIVFNTENVLLEYLKEWPKLNNINSQVQFTQKGMKVIGRHSKIYSAQSQNVVVDLDDYFERVLLITSDIKSTLSDGLKFLEQSRLVSQDVLNIIDAKGNIGINLDLKIPLDKDDGSIPDAPETNTKIKLHNVDYYPPGFERKDGLVSHLNGELIIHNESINAKNISAKIMGKPAKIVIKTDKLASASKKDPDVSVNIDSEISIKKLKEYNLISEMITPLSEQLSGTSNIKLNIDLPNGQRAFAFNIYTGLKDIQSKLPAPFNKEAKQILPFVMSYVENVQTKKEKKKSARLKMKFSKILSLDCLLDLSSDTGKFELLKGNIAFEGDKAKLPKGKLLKITGALKHVPFEQWKSIFDTSEKKNKPITSVSKNKSPVKGITIPIEISMTELVLPKIKFEPKTSKKSISNSTNNSGDGFKPEFFPLLNGHIDSIKLGEIDLGRFEIQSSRVDKDIVFDALNLDGELIKFKGKGKWHHWNIIPEVDVEGSADIPSLQKMAIAFGYDQLIREGKTKISGYISWPGGLNDFSKQSIEGKLNFQVEKGAWIEGKPGAGGRLLGLLNMNAFARRLSLDFSDVSKDGFEFDIIEGDFRFNNAMAYTDNLKIDSPSAKILVRGSTGLVTEEIDQRVTVIPEVSATLPLAGAAVAGPAGAAVVWVGQKILGDRINQVTAYDYTIKGDWENPVIKKDKTSQNTLNKIKQLFKLDENESMATTDEDHFFDTDTSELP